MNVLAAESNNVIVKMTIVELRNLAGFDTTWQFDQSFGCSSKCDSKKDVKSLVDVENIPVSEIYAEAKETLAAYENLHTKFESIRNQLTTLMKKMVLAKPDKKED